MNWLTESLAVSPQISIEDIVPIAEAGFTTIICNRPDAEVPPSHHAARMREAAEDAGVTFVDNPFSHQALSAEIIEQQAQALSSATGPVFAYCASGNRCTILWALTQAGKQPATELIETAAKAGYDLRGLAPMLGG